MLAKFDAVKFYTGRKNRHLSQAAIAEKAGTTIRYVRDLEHGTKSNPSASMLYRLSGALEMPMEALMTESKEDEL